jgi:Caspase domain
LRFAHGLLVALGILLATSEALAETRIALIIGNSEYADSNLKLSNPVNDALAMQAALRDAGFETIVKLNATRRDFYRLVNAFGAKIKLDPNAVGLFYYAGHGVQADGINYLIPVDAAVESQSDLEVSAFDAARVLQAMKNANNEMNIVILDACRDNPLPKTRGMERGLARMSAPSGTFVGYAAALGQTAHDGAKGGNGVFTGELVKAMAKPGLPLEQVFKQVIAGVRTGTHGSQQPWSESSIQGDFYFHAPQQSQSQPPPTQPEPVEQLYWKSIQNSHNPADFRAYLSKYPRGEFAGLAQNRLTSAVASPRPPAAQAPHTEATKTDARCESIRDRSQLGETLDDEDRRYAAERCH